MCGILGGNISGWNYKRAIESMVHRGPDGMRIIETGGIYLAFTRLSIIDLSSRGMQPMFSKDGNVGIVFNGEIYQYSRLRKKLENKYEFFSETDTEVVLNAYLEYGDAFIDKIDGMFSIAIWDSRNRKLKLYRDRVGIKPLYYYYEGNKFGFSSELKGIVNLLPDKKWDIDFTAVYDYVTYSYIPAPKSIYKNVYKLEPAHCLVYDLEKNKIEKNASYWRLNVSTKHHGNISEGEASEILRSKIKKSVENQIVADVQVGTLLSGGVDSSIVTFEGHSINNDIKTFSMGFKNKEYDEIEYARQLVNKWNLKNYERLFDEENYIILKKYIKDWFDEPFCDVSMYPTYSILQLAKENGVKVILTGDGGDEVFGGYNIIDIFNKKNGNKNRIISDVYEKYIRGNFSRNLDQDELFLDEVAYFSKYRNFILKKDKMKYAKRFGIPKDYDDYWFIRKHYHSDLPPITRAQIIDFNTFLPAILTKVDRTSMSLSLEVRVPLLSKDVIEYSFSLPQDIRCKNGMQKELLKQAYPEIPDNIKYRKKQGFGMPGEYISKKRRVNEVLLQTVWREVYKKSNNLYL